MLILSLSSLWNRLRGNRNSTTYGISRSRRDLLISEKTWRVTSPKAVRFMFGVKHSILTGPEYNKTRLCAFKIAYYAPNFDEVDGAYWFRVVPACVHSSILPFKNQAC